VKFLQQSPLAALAQPQAWQRPKTPRFSRRRARIGHGWNWELDTISTTGFDTEKTASPSTLRAWLAATRRMIAFQGGAVRYDRQRLGSGSPPTARLAKISSSFLFPRRRRMLVPEAATAQTLDDMKGKKVGIAGGQLD